MWLVVMRLNETKITKETVRREMKRLELGDDYQSSDTEESQNSGIDDDSYGDEESYGAEIVSKK